MRTKIPTPSNTSPASSIPTLEQVQDRLSVLTTSEMEALAQKSGQSKTNLWLIRAGRTKNPGIETVRAIWAHTKTPRKKALASQARTAARKAANA